MTGEIGLVLLQDRARVVIHIEDECTKYNVDK